MYLKDLADIIKAKSVFLAFESSGGILYQEFDPSCFTNTEYAFTEVLCIQPIDGKSVQVTIKY